MIDIQIYKRIESAIDRLKDRTIVRPIDRQNNRLIPGFVTSYRGSFQDIMTKEEKVKRTQRSNAQKKAAHHFTQLFWLALKAD